MSSREICWNNGNPVYSITTPGQVRVYRNKTVKELLELGISLTKQELMQFINAETIQGVDKLKQKAMSKYFAS